MTNRRPLITTMPKKITTIQNYSPKDFPLLLGNVEYLYAEIRRGEYGYSYMVLTTRRCLNLEYALEEEKAEVEGIYKGSTILSNYGWFLHAQKYAEYYSKHGSFPSTIYVDDMLLHGRTLQHVFDGFTSLVAYHLGQTGVKYSKTDVMFQLLKAVDIVVVAQNDTRLYLSREYEWKLNPMLMCNTTQGHMISQQILNYFIDNGILNTSYIISAYGKEEIEFKSGKWKRIFSDTEGLRQEFFILQDPLLSNNVQVTVRYNVIGNKAYLTPYVLHGSITDTDTLFQTIATIAESHALLSFAQMAEKVREDFPYQLLECYYQMADMLIGQVALSLFMQEMVSTDQIFSFDTIKIARSFTPDLHVWDLDCLVDISWTRRDLVQLCAALGQQSILPNQWQLGLTHRDKQDNDRLMRDAYYITSNVMVKHAIRSEIDVVEKTNTADFCGHAALTSWDQAVSRWSRDEREMPVDHFVSQCIDESKHINIRNELQQNSEFLLASLFKLFDSDFAALRVKVVGGAMGKPTAMLTVRHTEMSISIYYHRLSAFWPSLENVFWFCRRNAVPYNRGVEQYLTIIRSDREAMGLLKKCSYDIERCSTDLLDIAARLQEYSRLYSPLISWRFAFPSEDTPSATSFDTDRMYAGLLQQIREQELEWRLIKISDARNQSIPSHVTES